MPFTPFHFGPGALMHAAAPRQVSFWAFCTANVLIDIEPLYYMLSEQYPLHRFFHTYIGASLIVGATLLLLLASRSLARYMKLANYLNWQALTLRALAIGAALGAYSHVLLDSLMHPDITPLAPFSTSNPLQGAISLGFLHLLCVGMGILALFIIYLRDKRGGKV